MPFQVDRNRAIRQGTVPATDRYSTSIPRHERICEYRMCMCECAHSIVRPDIMDYSDAALRDGRAHTLARRVPSNEPMQSHFAGFAPQIRVFANATPDRI